MSDAVAIVAACLDRHDPGALLAVALDPITQDGERIVHAFRALGAFAAEVLDRYCEDFTVGGQPRDMLEAIAVAAEDRPGL